MPLSTSTFEPEHELFLEMLPGVLVATSRLSDEWEKTKIVDRGVWLGQQAGISGVAVRKYKAVKVTRTVQHGHHRNLRRTVQDPVLACTTTSWPLALATEAESGAGFPAFCTGN